MAEIWLERMLGFGLFWGIWLMVPLLIDASITIVYFISFLRSKKKDKIDELNFFPHVSIIIPVHNSAPTLEACLESIFKQTYPRESIQVICVNNGSKDNSFQVFNDFLHKHPGMSVGWSSLEQAGKSIALNAGIYSSHGSYIINVDSDTWLREDAIYNVVRKFESDPTLAAATGSIRVDKKLGDGSSFLDFINYCEVLEYIMAFDIGRRYQDRNNSLFTLSGAFSIFRREIILQTFLYQSRTVSEDTDLTFNIRKAIDERQGRVGFVSDAIAFVEPIEDLSRLYSQRLRWQRGEVEVVGLYYEKIPSFFRALFDFVGRILITDHTIVFLRLAWTFLLPFLYFLGYPLPTIMLAMIGMYICYILLETCTFYIVYRWATKEFRKELRKIWWIVPLMPLYRYIVYWFRLAGVLTVLTEAKSWKTQNPILELQTILEGYAQEARDKISERKRVDL